MLSALRQPKWLVTGLVIVGLAALFIRLGFWQLDRLEERRVANETGEARFGAEPVELETLLAAADDPAAIEQRRVVLRGEWDRSEEVLIRSQVHLGQAGFDVITPLVLADGSAVLVNRGWVPLTMDEPPVEAEPTAAEGAIVGWVELSATRPALGPEDQPRELAVFSRVDIDRIGEQMPYELAPVYVVALGERGDDLPVPVAPPEFSSEGPHLGYAIQWFGFAAIGLVGFYFLLRRKGTSADSPRD
jgi:surfeit locus 1 family protein